MVIGAISITEDIRIWVTKEGKVRLSTTEEKNIIVSFKEEKIRLSPKEKKLRVKEKVVVMEKERVINSPDENKI